MTNLLEVKNLKMHFPITGGLLRRQVAVVHAVDGVSFNIKAGETVGLVGESGCGKTSVGRSVSRLYDITSGSIVFDGQDISCMSRRQLKSIRREMQIVFQDPFESLNSRHTVGTILEEPFLIHGIGTHAERQKEIAGLLDRVGLPLSAKDKFPHEFSGGQRQRIGIARAISLKPKLVICDEPVSALDVSIQSQVVNLLLDLQKEMNLAFLFIAHDLAVVRHVSDRIAVMYLGQIVEFISAKNIYENPRHPYTQALISAIPHPDPRKRQITDILEGDVPSPIDPPSGCRFRTRCKYAKEICSREMPKLTSYMSDSITLNKSNSSDSHMVACHFSDKLPQV